jgi:hypothetical protein
VTVTIHKGGGAKVPLSVARGAMPKLIIQLMNEEWTVDLQVGSNVLGRATTCNVPVKDASLSRQHCDIVYVGGAATVVDKGSLNGTLVNGRKVSEQKLEPGDKVAIGATTIWFERKNVAAERKPPTAEVRRPASAAPVAEGRKPSQPAVQQSASSGAHPSQAGTRRSLAPQKPAPQAAATVRAAAADLAKADSILEDYSYRGRSGGSWGKMVAAGVVVVALGVGAYFAKDLLGSAPVKEEDHDNLVQNGSFDGMGPGRPSTWHLRASGVLGPAEKPSSSLTVDPTQGRNGSPCLQLDKAGSGGDLAVEAAYAEQLPLGGGGQVRAEAWTRADGFGGRVAWKIDWLRGVNGSIVAEEYSDPPIVGAAGWTKMGATFTPPAGAAAFRVALSAVGRAGRIYFDDVVVKMEPGGAPREKKLGTSRVTASRQGVASIALRNKAVISNIGVRLENDKEGVSSQAFATDVQTSEDETSLKFTGKMLHPSDLREIEFEGRIEAVQGGTAVYYLFKPENLRQVDRVTIVMTLPREAVQIPERAEEGTGRISFATDDGDVAIEYPLDLAKIRTRKMEGRIRVAQSFAVDTSGTDELGFGLKIRDAGAAGGSANPVVEAEEFRRKGKLGQALSSFKGHVKSVKENQAREKMETDIRVLEETEKRDWADVQARVFQARLTRRADQVSAAHAAVTRFLEAWAGEGTESKANALRSEMDKELANSPEGEGDRPHRILDRAKRLNDSGKKAIVQVMLRVLLERYPQSDAAPEADQMLKTLGQ